MSIDRSVLVHKTLSILNLGEKLAAHKREMFTYYVRAKVVLVAQQSEISLCREISIYKGDEIAYAVM